MKLFILFLLPLITFHSAFSSPQQCSDSFFQKKIDRGIELYQNYVKNPALRPEAESYLEETLPPIIDSFIQCMKTSGYEEKKAKMLLEFYIKLKNSASEALTPYLSRLYSLSEERVIQLIQSFSKEDRVYLTDLLEFSWDNVHYDPITRKIKEKPESLKKLITKRDLSKKVDQ